MAKQTAPSTQEHLPIAGIVDGTVLMSDGSLRAVLKLDPINFDLKSEQEQNAIIYAYQSFLNSLDFPIQIVVQSKKLDLEQYLIRMQASQKNVVNELLRIQIEDYTGFIRRLISVANIMSKRFYVIVSYSPVTKASSVAQFSSIFHHQPVSALMDEDEFKRYRAEVHNRAGIIGGGIGRLGVKSRILNTQELIELFYAIYNPDLVAEERLTDVENLNVGIISSPEMDQSPQPQEAPPAPAPTPVATEVDSPLAIDPLDAPVEPPAYVPPAPTPEATPDAPTPPAPAPAPAGSVLDEPITESDEALPVTAPPPAPATAPSMQQQVPTPPVLNLEDLFNDEPPSN